MKQLIISFFFEVAFLLLNILKACTDNNVSNQAKNKLEKVTMSYLLNTIERHLPSQL